MEIPRAQTHWVNLFGTVYKMELPKEDILTLKQWEEHNQTAVLRSFLTFLFNELKFKVSEMHVKLSRLENSKQNQLIKPHISSQTNIVKTNHTENKESNATVAQTDRHEGDNGSVKISQQFIE